MKLESIKQLIAQENDEREYHAKQEARSIINAIGAEQAKISNAQSRIGELRKQLQALEAETVDSAAVLGEVG